MCTSISLTTKDKKNILARNIDFVEVLPARLYLIPRNYNWMNEADSKYYKTTYAMTGMGSEIKNHPLFVDGLNEKGLMGAVLYFPKYADFNEKSSSKPNIEAYDLLLWALTSFKDIAELTEQIDKINLVEENIKNIIKAPPLHWIFKDRSGKCIVIEKTSNGLKIYDDSIGVLTNSPDFNWQKTNYSLFMQSIGIPNDVAELNGEFLNTSLNSLDTHMIPGLSLPGDFSPQSRFLKAAYLRNKMPQPANEAEGIVNAFKILDNVVVPKGVKYSYNISPDGKPIMDLTLSQNVMCSESVTYYYSSYYNREVNAIRLFDHDLDAEEITRFELSKKQAINYI